MTADLTPYKNLPEQYSQAAKEDPDMAMIDEWLRQQYAPDFSEMKNDLMAWTSAVHDLVEYREKKQNPSAGKPKYELLEAARSVYREQEELQQERNKLDAQEKEVRQAGVPFISDVPLSELARSLHLRLDTEKRFLSLMQTMLYFVSDEGAAFTLEMANPGELVQDFDLPSMEYATLGPKRVMGYKYWRKHIKMDIPMPANLKYLLLFARELLLGVGASTPEEGLELLLRLTKYYLSPNSTAAVSVSLCRCVAAYCFHYNVPLPPRAMDLLPAWAVNNEIFDLWLNAVLLDPNRTTVPASAAAKLAKFNFYSGASWNEDPEALMALLDELLQFLDARYRAQGTAGHPDRDKLLPALRRPMATLGRYGETRGYSFSFLSYDFYLPSNFVPEGRLYTIRQFWAFYGGVAASADVTFRKLHGLRGSRSGKLNKSPEVNWVQDFLKLKQQKKEIPVQLEVLELDPARINKLRQESNHVREALKTEEDRRLSQEQVDEWLSSLNPDLKDNLFVLIQRKATPILGQKVFRSHLQSMESSLEHPLFVQEKTGINWNPQLMAFIEKSRLYHDWLRSQKKEESPLSQIVNALPQASRKALSLLRKGKREQAEETLMMEGTFLDVLAEELNDQMMENDLDDLLILDEEGEFVLNPVYADSPELKNC